MNHKNSKEFRHPVPWKSLGLADYPKVIEYPMDLNTVRKNLHIGKYKHFYEFFSDIQLIWDNAKYYNGVGSYLYK